MRKSPLSFPSWVALKGLLLGLLWVIPVAAAAPDPAEGARLQAVQRFYARITPRANPGAPGPAEMKALSPLISHRLRQALLAAQGRQIAEQKTDSMVSSYPGYLFFSLYEGADRVTGIRRDPKARGAAYLVGLEYADPQSKGSVTRWEDRAHLVKEGGRWVVDDIDLLGDWPFSPHCRLTQLLPRPGKRGVKGP